MKTAPFPMKVVLPRRYPAVTVALPCSRCGRRGVTVGMYLTAEAEAKGGGGFYPSLSIRLCGDCIREAAKAFPEGDLS